VAEENVVAVGRARPAGQRPAEDTNGIAILVREGGRVRAAVARLRSEINGHGGRQLDQVILLGLLPTKSAASVGRVQEARVGAKVLYRPPAAAPAGANGVGFVAGVV
jgi:hypothetical protein